MKVMLVGPNDLEQWFLGDSSGNTFLLVAKWQDFPDAAKLFGWNPSFPSEMLNHELVEQAREYLAVHSGEYIEAPFYVAQHFEQIVSASIPLVNAPETIQRLLNLWGGLKGLGQVESPRSL